MHHIYASSHSRSGAFVKPRILRHGGHQRVFAATGELRIAYIVFALLRGQVAPRTYKQSQQGAATPFLVLSLRIFTAHAPN